MKFAPLLVLLSTIHLLFAADPSLVMVKHAIGGAGSYDSLSSEIQWGVIVGQPYAIANTKLKHLTGDASGTDPYMGSMGFWMEVTSIADETPIQSKPNATQNQGISAFFGENSVRVVFHFESPTQASIRLVDVQGKNRMPTWTADLPAGETTQQLQFNIPESSTSFLIIKTSTLTRTFRLQK